MLKIDDVKKILSDSFIKYSSIGTGIKDEIDDEYFMLMLEMLSVNLDDTYTLKHLPDGRLCMNNSPYENLRCTVEIKNDLVVKMWIGTDNDTLIEVSVID